MNTNTSPLNFVRLAPDARQLVHRDAEGVWVIDRLTGGRTSLLRHAHEEFLHMAGAAFTQDGRLFAFDPGDSVIRLFEWNSRSEVGGLHYDESLNPQWGILGLAFSPDGRWLVAAGFDGLQAWEVATRRKVWFVPRTGNENWNASPTFSPDGRLLVTVSTDQRVQLWDVANWTEVTTLRGHEFEVWDAVFTRDGSRLITAGKDKTIRVWPVPQPTPEPSSINGIGSTVGPVSQWQWDPALGRRPTLVPIPTDRARATLSRDGTQMVVLYGNGQWAVSDPETGQLRNAGEWPEYRFGSPEAAVSNDGRWVAFGVDRELVVYGAQGGGEPRVRLKEGPRMTDRAQDVLCFAPNGHHVLFATASDAVRLLDTETGQVETLFEPTGQRVYSVNFSPDGRRVAAAYSGALVRWRDLGSPMIHELPTDHSEFVISLAFSPDGEVLATGSFDPGVRLWRLSDGARIADLSGSLQAYLTVQFSADGRRLAAGSFEGHISVWDTQQNPPLEVLQRLAHTAPGRPRPVFPLRFRSDDSLIAKSGNSLSFWWAPSMSKIDEDERGEESTDSRVHAGSAGSAVPTLSTQMPASTSASFEAWLRRRWAAERLNAWDLPGAARADPRFAPLVRDPRATASHVDLAPHFNGSLAPDGLGTSGVDWREFPQGFREFAGTMFDARGLVHVYGRSQVEPGAPKSIQGIRVGAKGARIQALQGTYFEADDGTQVGRYVLHYADGQTAELPIVYGRDTRNWWTVSGEPAETPHAAVVWRGATPAATAAGQSLRLWKRTYPNPRPDMEIAALDFISAEAYPAPFVIAITVE